MKRKRLRRTTSPPGALYLDVHAVAVRYGVKPRTVWGWLDEGKIPPPLRFTAGTARWSVRDLEAWEEEKRQERAPRRQWEEARRRERMKEAKNA